MLAHPKIGHWGPKPGGRPVRRPRRGPPSSRPRRPTGARIGSSRAAPGACRVGRLPLRLGAGRAGRCQQLVERRILDADDVRAAAQRLRRGEQRVEVGIEADRDVADGHVELAAASGARRRTRPAGRAVCVDRDPEGIPVASDGGRGRVGGRVGGLVRAQQLERERLLLAAQVPLAVDASSSRPSRSAFPAASRSYGSAGDALPENSGELVGIERVGADARTAVGLVDERLAVDRLAAARRGPRTTRRLGCPGRRLNRTAVSVEPG